MIQTVNKINENLKSELLNYNKHTALPEFDFNETESGIYNNLVNLLNEDKFETFVPIVTENSDADPAIDFFKNSRESVQSILKPATLNLNFDISKGKTPHVSKFIADNYNKVKKLADKYGYSPEFVLSIMRIETSNGKDSDYINHNIGFNMQSRAGDKSVQQQDKDRHGNVYVAGYKTYNTIEESIEDFLKWCKRHNIQGSTDEELAYSFAQSPFAEGIGATKEEANNKLYQNYLNTIKDTKEYISRMTS